MITEKRYFPASGFRICVDTIEEGFCGRVYSPLSSDAIDFVGIGEVLVKMDELFDQNGYPQAFQDKRTFVDENERSNSYKGIPEHSMQPDEILSKQGEINTIDIVVRTRQNTSWQGTIYKSTGEKYLDFDGEIGMMEGIAELLKVLK